MKKQIRFAGLDDSPETSVEMTPPPKEFKRTNDNRKTMRPMSMLVTERDRAALVCVDSPKAPSGFVRSMCQLYEDEAPPKAAKPVGRSNSFNTSLNNSSSSCGSSSSHNSTTSSQTNSPSPR